MRTPSWTIEEIVRVIRRERRREKDRRRPLFVTDEMRSMIATVFVAAWDYEVPIVECKRRSLCCSLDAFDVCLSIIGGSGPSSAAKAERLQTWVHRHLSCCGWNAKEYRAPHEQSVLDQISELEEL